MKSFFKEQQGYIALVGILLLGAGILVALLSVGLSVGTGTKMISQRGVSEKSYFLAMTCAEEALGKLWASPAYSGNEVLAQDEGLCGILAVENVGGKKIVKTYGTISDLTRRMKLTISTTTPQIIIEKWEDIPNF